MNRERKKTYIGLFLTSIFIHLLLFQFVSLAGQQTQDAVLQQAEKLYKEFRFQDVITLLEREKKNFKSEEHRIMALEWMTRSYFQFQNMTKVRETFRELLQLNPEYVADKSKFSPDQRKTLEQIKKESIAYLILYSNPKNLQVYIDGRLQKQRTPNKYLLLSGQHRIMVQSPDSLKYKSWEDIDFFEAGKEKIKTANLEAITPPTEPKEGPPTPFWKKLWFLGGLGAAAAVATAWFIIGRDKDGNGTLPEPPARPKK